LARRSYPAPWQECRSQARERASSRTQADASCAPSAKAGDYLLVSGEATGCLLGVGKPTIHLDLKNTTARSAQIDLRRRLSLEDQFARRTGDGFVTSLTAVFDLNLHQISFFRISRTEQPATKLTT
jgi:hypothetical protein